MTTKILCPAWDNLSKKQKQLATEWIKSLISFRITTTQLSDSLFEEASDNSLNPIDNAIKNFQFEVVDSSTTSEGISITEIIPPVALRAGDKPIEGLKQLLCLLKCWEQGHTDCVNKCT
ncbi:hypothetical protein QUA71_22270 [Microcoleus sp. MON1_C5]|uniref:hypothetical protein n=1 Tax=Microcoleus sp. MON1_C5 TaxID=2818828 RepID=UPI002FD2350A